MNSKNSPKSDPHAARVVLWDSPANMPEPKIIHAVKVSPTGKVDPVAYERALRETISFENGLVEFLSDGSLRETLPYLPDLSALAENESSL